MRLIQFFKSVLLDKGIKKYFVQNLGSNKQFQRGTYVFFKNKIHSVNLKVQQFLSNKIIKICSTEHKQTT